MTHPPEPTVPCSARPDCALACPDRAVTPGLQEENHDEQTTSGPKSCFSIRRWEPTGDPKMPLACVWIASKRSQSASTASSTDETGKMPPVRLAKPPFEAVATPAEGVRVAVATVRRSWQKHVLTLLMVFGPREIPAEARGSEPSSVQSCPN